MRKISGLWRLDMILPDRTFQALTVVCAGMLLCGTSQISASGDLHRPNVIYIMADDLGYGELGCYGQTRIKTPVLDKMASEGARFTQFYSGAPVCAPARCTFITGMHTGHSFVRGNGNPPQPNDPPTFGMLMKSAGYATGCFGKWGLGNYGTVGSPASHGFDEFVGFISQVAAHNQYPDTLYRNDQTWHLPEGTYANDVFTSESLDFVRRHAKSPFFLYIPYTIPHQKLVVPSQGAYANENWPESEKNKAAMITRMDSQIGELLALLKELKIDDNTLVFFTSDNGPHKEGTDPKFFQSSGPLQGIKRDLYEGGIRVPMIARWPGKIAATANDAQVWAMWDVMPSVLDIAGITDPAKRDGISIKANLLEGKAVEHGPLYWEFYERGFAQAVRKGDWKLLRTTTGALELFDLARDPGEQNSLSAERPEIVTELMPLLTDMRVDSPHWKMRFALHNKGKVPTAGDKVKKKRQKRSKGKHKMGAAATQ